MDVKQLILDNVGTKEEDQKSISYSQYSIYKECPFRWKLTYKDKLHPFTSGIASVFGTAMHETVQEWLRLLYDVSVKASEEFNFEEYLSDRLVITYQEEKEKNGGKNFIKKEDMEEHYEDGIKVLEYLRRKRKKLFDYREEILIAVELPLYVPILEGNNKILFNGYIDLLLYNKVEKTFRIPDIKTSKKGWDPKYQLKDELKLDQVRLYKHYLAKYYNLDINKIEGSYMVLKRKIWEDSEFPIPRVQVVVPAQGSGKIKLAVFNIEEFVKTVFNEDGSYREDITFRKNASEHSCRFCPYAGKPELCNQKN